jgi:hypothetical protein
MTKTDSPTTQNLYEWLKTKVNQEMAPVPLGEVLPSVPSQGDKEALFRDFFTLMVNHSIEIGCVTGAKGQVMVRLLQPTQFAMDDHIIKVWISTIHIMHALFGKVSCPEFSKYTQNYFSAFPLMVVLKQENAVFTDWVVLSRFLTNFFSSGYPMNLTEFGLDTGDFMTFYEEIYAQQNLFQRLGWLEFGFDRQCPYAESILTPALLNIIKITTPKNKKVRMGRRQFQGVFQKISCQDLQPCTLYLDAREQSLFEMLGKMSYAPKRPLTVLLSGKSGTGKTEWVYQLARQVNADVFQLNFHHIKSKWVGETEKNIYFAFEQYQKQRLKAERPVFMLLNEADGLLGKRISAQNSNDAFYNAVQSALLEILEHFEGHLFATTNRFDNIDQAYHRRFTFKVNLEGLDAHGRKKLIANLPFYHKLPSAVLHWLAEGQWTAGEFKQLEQKLAFVMDGGDPDEALLMAILTEEGLLGRSAPLGFQRPFFHILQSSLQFPSIQS